MQNSLLQKDYYCVYNDFNVELRTKELNLLYLPLIGSDAIKIYQFLGTKILGEQQLSKNYMHYDIFDSLAIDISKFIVARKKLEAVGLLSSYYIDNEGSGQYVYKIHEALNFNEFFSTPVFSQLLENMIGSTSYKEIKTKFSYNKVSFKSFQDLTAKFSDVYRLENIDSYSLSESILNSDKGPNFDEYYFDFNKLNYFLASSYLNEVLEDKKTKDGILGLAHLYKVTPQDMAKAVEKSVDLENSNPAVNMEKLKDYLVQLHINVRKQKVPVLDSMLNKKLTEEISEDLTEEQKFARETDNTNFVDYLNKQKGITLSSVSAKAITELQEKYNFPRGVLNILLEYCINASDGPGLPHINYIDQVASRWSGLKLLGAQDAIDHVRKNRNVNNFKNNSKTKQNNSSVRKTNNYSGNKQYVAHVSNHMQKRIENIGSLNSSKERVVTKEDEEEFNKLMESLNKKEG